MKFKDLANQYKGRHLEFKIKPKKKLEDTVFPLGIAKAISMKGVVKEMMKDKINFDLMDVMTWSRIAFRKGKWRSYIKSG